MIANLSQADPCEQETRSPDVKGIETKMQAVLCGRIRELRLSLRADGVVLYGIARTYYEKQLAQHELMQATPLPLASNEIQVGTACTQS